MKFWMLLTLTLLTTAAVALSPPPPLPVKTLTAFYEAMNGDDWHRNDGWLDPEVDVCDWYGITCVTEAPELGGYKWIGHIRLPSNNLHGQFTTELLEDLWPGGPASIPSVSLDLSGNAITGELTHFPWRIERMNLADNLLGGPLPAAPEKDLEELQLARNNFQGAIPKSWEHLQLRWLDLSDNHLDTGADHAFAAMHGSQQSFLYLNGNHFVDELGPEIMNAALNERDPYAAQGGGLDLCFNDLQAASSEVADWIAARHAGSPDWQACQSLDRQEITPAISGSWFNPQRSGEGFSLLLMENGAPLLYHFGFDAEGRQQWLFEVGYTEDVFLRWGTLYETAGFFNEGISQFTEVEDALYLRDTGRMRIDFLANGELSVLQHIGELARCGPWRPSPPYPPPPDLCVMPWYESRAQYIQLTELSGATDCSLRNPLRHYSGAWFNPERTGEGFMVEVMDNNDALVYWFTHEPESAHGEDVAAADQAWMMGLGTIEWIPGLGDVAAVVRLEVDLIQPIGGQGGYDFDPELVEQIDWGTLVLQFNQEDAGWATWASNVTGYGEGEYEIERLARPMLANCD